MTVSVRAARPEEYGRIGEITAAAFVAGGTPVGSEYLYDLRDVAGRADRSEVLVAVDEQDLPVGAVALTWYGSSLAEVCREGEAEFRMLAVDPAAQGQGAGEALVRHCLERATALRCEAVTITTAPRSASARRLYERLGFVRVPARDRSYGENRALLAYRTELTAAER